MVCLMCSRSDELRGYSNTDRQAQYESEAQLPASLLPMPPRIHDIHDIHADRTGERKNT